MSKKYTISNNSFNTDSYVVFYIFYIILFFILLFVINFIFTTKYIDMYDNVSSSNSSQEQVQENILSELNLKSEEINSLKNKLEQQNRQIYISQNYDKIDSSSFDVQLALIKNDFSKTDFPNVDLSKYTTINSKDEYDLLVNQCSSMKNYYKPGEIVTANSTLNINKNNICYRTDGKPMENINEISKKYSECMVCSVIPDSIVKDSNSWKNTKTNIDKVCLFNSKSQDSNIPDLNQCKKFCSL